MIYFVTEAYLKANTPITQNVSATDVMPYIAPVCSSWVQNILGTYFFKDLLTKFNAQTLSNDEELLVDKMKPAIAWRSASDCVIGLTYQLKNKGLQKQNGDNSESVELNEAQFVTKHYEQKAEFYESMLRKYLIINKDLYSKYTSKLNNDSELPPQTDDNFNTDIMFI
jgi:hypothetical protein